MLSKKKLAYFLSPANFCCHFYKACAGDRISNPPARSGGPHVRNVKALTNHKYQYRLRVERYRVFFDFDGAVHGPALHASARRFGHQS